MRLVKCSLLLWLVANSDCFKILGIFPYDGRSHHIFFSSLVEKLAYKGHEVTIINYHPLKKISTLRQIFLEDQKNSNDTFDMEEYLNKIPSDMVKAIGNAQIFKNLADTNCRKLMANREVHEMIKSRATYDVVIVEQFMTDCGLAIAYKLNAPTVGVTAHILLPWTYSRLGAPDNAAFVQNTFFASESKPSILYRMKSAITNFGMNMFYKYVIQKNDQEIVNEYYPEVPSLEELGKNMSLIMVNQYFPLTGPRIYGPNVIEIGGMQINEDNQVLDEDLQKFLDTSDTEVVYISFGTVAANLPKKLIDEIKKFIGKSNLKFVWKTDLTDWTSRNALLKKWIPQVPLLCHPKVAAFVTHSGMLSTSEAMYCGVPLVSVPLFGDQFSNAMLAVENGLGTTINVATLNVDALENSLNTVLQDRYKEKAKKLSRLWRDRPLSAMNTAIYWIEYVARNKDVNLKPPTVDLPFYEYFMVDVLFLISLVVALLLVTYILLKIVSLVTALFRATVCKQGCRKSKKE